MGPKEKLAALRTEAGQIRKRMLDGQHTEADIVRATEIATEAGELEAIIARTDAAASALDGMANTAPEGPTTTDDGRPVARSLGEAFTQSDAYQAFKRSHPNGLQSSGSETPPVNIAAKGIGRRLTKVDPAPLQTPTTSNPAPVREGGIDDLVYRPQRRFLELVTRGTTDTPWSQYRQVIEKTNNASIVPEARTTTGTTIADGLKPLSTLVTRTAESRAHVYADGIEVTNQELSDDGAIQALIDGELRENLDIELERVLLHGAGTADEPAGVFNTTGVLQQAFDTDVPTTVRRAIGLLRRTSGTNIRGVVLNPEDDETWDLLKDSQDRYLGNGPFGTGPGTAWGYERIDSQSIEVGQALVGDFSTINLLNLEPVSVLAFNQHKDYAQRNLIYIRAERRDRQLIRNAAKLCVVDLTAGV